MTRMRALPWAAASLALAACNASACPGPEQGFVRLASADAEIAYRWEPDKLKVGQFFGVEVVACRVPGGEAIGTIVVDAQMPAHGHGMNYHPKSTQLAPDRYLVSGLMLHMAGHWRVTFDLFQGDKRTHLARDVTLKP